MATKNFGWRRTSNSGYGIGFRTVAISFRDMGQKEWEYCGTEGVEITWHKRNGDHFG